MKTLKPKRSPQPMPPPSRQPGGAMNAATFTTRRKMMEWHSKICQPPGSALVGLLRASSSGSESGDMVGCAGIEWILMDQMDFSQPWPRSISGRTSVNSNVTSTWTISAACSPTISAILLL